MMILIQYMYSTLLTTTTNKAFYFIFTTKWNEEAAVAKLLRSIRGQLLQFTKLLNCDKRGKVQVRKTKKPEQILSLT